MINDQERAALAAPTQAATAKQSPHPEYDKGFSDGWNQCEARQAAAPAQAGEYPAGTGNPEADRIIARLASSDPDFDDCADAVALIHKLVAEIKGPDGYATWKDVAVAERAARGHAKAAPEGWVPCIVTYEGQHPEEVAYGPEIMMKRLKKWLDRYFELRTQQTQAAPVDAQHSTACLYHYALSRLGLKDNTGLRVLFWDAHNRLSWDSKTDRYVTPDADEADCGQCNAVRAAQESN